MIVVLSEATKDSVNIAPLLTEQLDNSVTKGWSLKKPLFVRAMFMWQGCCLEFG